MYDTYIEGDPRATIEKMQQVRHAALSPAEPSASDRQVAARARQLERQAQTELADGETGLDRVPEFESASDEPPVGQRLDVTA